MMSFKNNFRNRKLVLHIGMHKTGSSSIQETLHHNLNDENVHYIKFSNPNHSGVLRRIFKEDLQNDHLVKFQNISREKFLEKKEKDKLILIDKINLSEPKNCILSAEEISNFTQNELLQMLRFFNSYFNKIVIIGYVRSPKSYIESAYQQILKGGIRKNFHLSNINPPYKLRFEKFDKVFGRENVYLYKFDPNSFPQKDVVLDFCDKIGIKMSKNKTIRINESLSLEAISLLYIYRKFYKYTGKEKTRFNSNKKLIEVLTTIGTKKFKVSNQYMKQVLERNNENIMWMEDRLGGKSLKEYFKDDDIDAINDEQELENIAFDSIKYLTNLLNNNNIIHHDTIASIQDIVNTIYTLELQVSETK